MSLMNEAFSQYLDKFIIVYLDDILIYSDTWEDHLDHIRKALKVLRKEKLYAKQSLTLRDLGDAIVMEESVGIKTFVMQ